MTRRWLFVLLLGIPPLAVALVGTLWFVGQSDGHEWTARIWVAKTEPRRVLVRGRVTSLPDRRAPGRALPVTAAIGGRDSAERQLTGETDAEGFVDFDVAFSREEPSYAVALEAGETRTALAIERWSPAQLPAPLRPHRLPVSVQLKPNGPLVTLELRHGVLTVPVNDELRVSWPAFRRAAGEVERLTVELEGAVGPGRQQRFTVGSGDAFAVIPKHHVVEITLSLHNGETQVSTGVALLPVQPGAIAARLTEEGQLRVISPVPRAEAHVLFATEQRVLALERVALRFEPHIANSEHAAPGYVGYLPLSPEIAAATAREGVWAVTSTDADFDSEAQVGWPLNWQSRGRTTRFAWGAATDGYDRQRLQLAQRRGQRRLCAWSALLALTIVELALLWALDRRAVTVDGSVASGATRFWVAACCVVLGFVGLGSFLIFW